MNQYLVFFWWLFKDLIGVLVNSNSNYICFKCIFIWGMARSKSSKKYQIKANHIHGILLFCFYPQNIT